jgi:hypothetical protein
MSTSEPDNELGRMLMAALIAYQGGISFNEALRRYVPKQVDSSWAQLGERLLWELSNPQTATDPTPAGNKPQ